MRHPSPLHRVDLLFDSPAVFATALALLVSLVPAVALRPIPGLVAAVAGDQLVVQVLAALAIFLLALLGISAYTVLVVFFLPWYFTLGRNLVAAVAVAERRHWSAPHPAKTPTPALAVHR